MPRIIKSDEVTHKLPFVVQHQRRPGGGPLSAETKRPSASAVPAKQEALVAAEQVLEETKRLSEQILQQARLDAGLILQKAAQETEVIRENARAEGYAQGYEYGERHGQDEGYRAGYQQGLEEGTSAARQEMGDKFEQAVKQAEALLVQAERERNTIVLSADRQIVELALAVAGKVLAREMEENPLIMLPVVTEALQKVRDQAQVVVRVNPLHYPLLLEARTDLQRMMGSQQTITILADQSLGLADCVLETGNGTVDARLETQLSRLRKRLEELVAR